MKCNFKTIEIERDPMTKIGKVVAPWEVPVYRSQYGDDKVLIYDKDVEVEVTELPDAKEEYLRLRDVFGIEPDTKQSHVDIVYGRGAQAIEPLERAIKGSIAGDVEKAQKVVDGNGKIDKDQTDRREKAYVDRAEDGLAEFVTQKSDVEPKPNRGLAKVVNEAADERDADAAKARADAAAGAQALIAAASNVAAKSASDKK